MAENRFTFATVVVQKTEDRMLNLNPSILKHFVSIPFPVVRQYLFGFMFRRQTDVDE